MYIDNEIISACLIGFSAGCFVAWALSSLFFRWLINTIIGAVIIFFIFIAILSDDGFEGFEEIILNLANFLWDYHIYGIIAFTIGAILVFSARRNRSIRLEDDRHQERMQRRDRPNAIL